MKSHIETEHRRMDKSNDALLRMMRDNLYLLPGLGRSCNVSVPMANK